MNEQETFMKERPVPGLVLSMAVPMMLSMLVNALYNIVDSYFVARIGEEAMTALSLVYPIQNLISAVGIGFGVGIAAVISVASGKADADEADAAAVSGLFLSIVHGAVLMILTIAVMPAFLKSYTSNALTYQYAIQYSTIAFLFSVLLNLQIAMEKVYQAVGRMATTMVCMLAGCIVNIIMDPVLIFGIGIFPQMGIAGAALATGFGQSIPLILYVVLYFVHPIPVRIRPQKLTLRAPMLSALYGVGIPATLNLALPSLMISVLNGILAVFSETCVLVLGAYYKLQTFLSLTTNGIVQGIRPLMGYNYGAKEYVRLKEIYRTALLMSACIMLAGMVLCLCIPEVLIGLFTTNPDTISLGVSALRIICFGFLASSVSVTTSGALEGMGMGTPSLVITALRYVVLLIPAAFVLSRFLGASGVWAAFPAAEWATAVVSYVLYRKKICLKMPIA